tara:strand:- start:102 stop:437 length:336 start_codon:yes stop_codon:yes gene_type:complete
MRKILSMLLFFVFLQGCADMETLLEDSHDRAWKSKTGEVSAQWAQEWGLPNRNWITPENLGGDKYLVQGGSYAAAVRGSEKYCASQNKSVVTEQSAQGDLFTRATIVFRCK